ncbi:MAG TPA: SBBP repeat-containing protein, partial [Emcibacteraceae bacterium]|nr:SBBP repeat-containing protein [Emcibacteraceae bacterium]
MKTIAEYAKDNKTSSSLIAGLSIQFQNGLSQVDQYIRSAQLDKLVLLAGEKKSYVTSTAALGRDNRNITGQAISISNTSALSGLNGDETFTLSLSDGFGVADNLEINLAEINGDITLSSIKDLINSKILSLTELNGNGETVSKYKSRIAIEEIGDGKYGFKFNVDGIEKISLNAASSSPSLIITSSNVSSDYGAVKTGTLTEYSNLDGSGLTKSYSHEIAGIDENGFVIPADLSEKNSEATKSTTVKYETTPTAVKVDSQGNSYVVGTTQGDFGGQINGAQT